MNNSSEYMRRIDEYGIVAKKSLLSAIQQTKSRNTYNYLTLTIDSFNNCIDYARITILGLSWNSYCSYNVMNVEDNDCFDDLFELLIARFQNNADSVHVYIEDISKSNQEPELIAIIENIKKQVNTLFDFYFTMIDNEIIT